MEDIRPSTADRILVMNSSHAAMFGPTKEIFARGAELEQMGLRVPQITKILAMLRERGWADRHGSSPWRGRAGASSAA